MANVEEIAATLSRLSENAVNPPEFTEEQLLIFEDSWKETDAELLHAAAMRHINTNIYFPKLAEINKLIAEERFARDERSRLARLEADTQLDNEVKEFERIQFLLEQTAHLPDCTTCQGAGFVIRLAPDDLVTFSQWHAMYPGGHIPHGEPTPDCPWERCAPCGGTGKRKSPDELSAGPDCAGPGEAGVTVWIETHRRMQEGSAR